MGEGIGQVHHRPPGGCQEVPSTLQIHPLVGKVLLIQERLGQGQEVHLGCGRVSQGQHAGPVWREEEQQLFQRHLATPAIGNRSGR